MSILNCYATPSFLVPPETGFSYSNHLEDSCGWIGKHLILPLYVITDRCYTLRNGKLTEFKINNLPIKILAVALIILMLPVSLPLISLGLVLISCSSSHKYISRLLHEGLPPPHKDLSKAFLRECFQGFLQKPLNNFQNYYGLNNEEMLFLERRYQMKQSSPLSAQELALCINKEHAWRSVCTEATRYFANEEGFLPPDITDNLLELYRQEGLFASTPLCVFQLAALIINKSSFNTSFAEENADLVTTVKSTSFRLKSYTKCHQFYRSSFRTGLHHRNLLMLQFF